MKQFKEDIVNRIVEEAQSCRIVSLYDVGREMGHKHILAQDCRDIMRKVLEQLPGYRAVQMLQPGMSNSTASLWTTLHFVDRELEFSDGPEYVGKTMALDEQIEKCATQVGERESRENTVDRGER